MHLSARMGQQVLPKQVEQRAEANDGHHADTQRIEQLAFLPHEYRIDQVLDEIRSGNRQQRDAQGAHRGFDQNPLLRTQKLDQSLPGRGGVADPSRVEAHRRHGHECMARPLPGEFVERHPHEPLARVGQYDSAAAHLVNDDEMAGSLGIAYVGDRGQWQPRQDRDRSAHGFG